MRRFFYWLIQFVYPPAVCWSGVHAPIAEHRTLLKNASRRGLWIAAFVEKRIVCYYCGHDFTTWVIVAGPVAVDPELTEDQYRALEAGETLTFEDVNDECDRDTVTRGRD